ncbi:Het-eN [Diaporthe sp. PMI_573]|nr:Het-eN [Diaporthaceae sp. PMI_573]
MESRSLDVGGAITGTCQWLFQHETYKSWVTSDRGLLWIKGKPGSGKSTLLKHAFDNHGAGRGDLVLSFFFHGRGDELQKSRLGFFRSLLHKVLGQAPDALSDLVETFEKRRKEIGDPGEKWQWNQNDLQRFFEESLPNVLKTHSVWLFVDALDECDQDAVGLVKIFKSLLKSRPSTGHKQFHICFSCRHYPILDLDDAFEVCLEKENQGDISTFVDNELSGFQVRRSSTITALIKQRASGVFMWARLVVKQVQDLEHQGVGLKKIEAAIDAIPPDLDKLYTKLIEGMGSDSLKLIQWICFAARPLSIDELRWAMVIEPDCPHQSLRAYQSEEDVADSVLMKTQVKTLSCGLDEVTRSSDYLPDLSVSLRNRRKLTPSSNMEVVQFIHQSVKDFFLDGGLSALEGGSKPTEAETARPETNEARAKADLAIGRAHHRLSRICIRYLAMEEIAQPTSDRKALASTFPLLHYATTSWISHVQQSEARKVPQTNLLHDFGWPSQDLVQRWVQGYHLLSEYSNACPPEGINLVHIAARYQLMGPLQAILSKDDRATTHIDLKKVDGRTPLFYAAERGHVAIVVGLLEKGADPNSKDRLGHTPLLFAAGRGHNAVVKNLLKMKANANTRDKRGATALHWAAYREHGEVISLLLGNKADVEAKDECDQTPLAWAIKSQAETSVKILLQRVVEVNYRYNLVRI